MYEFVLIILLWIGALVFFILAYLINKDTKEIEIYTSNEDLLPGVNQPTTYKEYVEEEYAEKMLYWNEKSIDNTYYAFRIFAILWGNEQRKIYNRENDWMELHNFIKRKSNFDIDNCKLFINTLYVSEYGGFKQSLKAIDTVYSTRLATLIDKYYYNGNLFTDNQKQKMIKYILDFKTLIPPNGIGFRDSVIKDIPKLTVTYGAFQTLRYLTGEESKEIEKKIYKFIMTLWNKKNGYFSDYLGEDKPKICCLHFALKSLQQIDKLEYQKFIKNNRKIIIDYLKSTWIKEKGFEGFAPSFDYKFLSIPHTRYALECLNLIYDPDNSSDCFKIDVIKKFEDDSGIKEIKKKICKSLEDLYNEEKEGFPFVKNDSPSLVATYSALQIMNVLNESEWIKTRQDNILSFLKSCRKENAYIGYPIPQIVLVH